MMTMGKRALILCCALLLLVSTVALADLKDRSFKEDMASWGEMLGEGMKAFGDEITKLSDDPQGYMDGNELLDQFEQKAREAGEAFSEHWPVLKSSVKGAVQAILDSDLSWEEKREELKKYGILAIPYLAEIDLNGATDNAKAAMGALKDFLSEGDDEQVRQWIEANKQRLQELRDYLES